MPPLLPFVLAAGLAARHTDCAYVLPPTEGQWIEAETTVAGPGKAEPDEPTCFGLAYAAPPEGKRVPFATVPWAQPGSRHVWARVRGQGLAVKRNGKKDLWRWPKCDAWQWVRFGALDGKSLCPSFTLMGDAAVDVVVLTEDDHWQPLEVPLRVPALHVRFGDRSGPVPPNLASANVNSPAAMLLGRDDWHEAVRGLGIRMMRFQVPAAKLDYRERDAWDEATFRILDDAVTAARERWGVETILFGVHRLKLPLADGKLLEDEFADYADGVARLVRRYSPPGRVRVQYWEPFNELDHASFLKKLQRHGQDFGHVAKLYAVCSQQIRTVNPNVKVGGPAAMWPGGWETKMMLEQPGMVADFVSWHQYATGSAATSDERLLASIHREKGMVDGLRRMQKAVRDAGRKEPLEFLLTEYHINHTIWEPPDRRGATALSAVFAASVLVNLGQKGADAAMIHDVLARQYGLVGPASGDAWSRGLGMVPRHVDADPIHMRPVGWVYRWFNQFVRGHWASCEWISTPPAWAGSPRRPVLEAAAATDGDHGIVVLINRDTDHHEVLLTGLTAVTPARSLDDRPVHAEIVDDHGARTAHLPAPAASGHWRCHLPPVSVAFVRFTRTSAE